MKKIEKFQKKIFPFFYPGTKAIPAYIGSKLQFELDESKIDGQYITNIKLDSKEPKIKTKTFFLEKLKSNFEPKDFSFFENIEGDLFLARSNNNEGEKGNLYGLFRCKKEDGDGDESGIFGCKGNLNIDFKMERPIKNIIAGSYIQGDTMMIVEDTEGI